MPARFGPPRSVVALALDAYLLASIAAEGQAPDGRAWEQAAHGLLSRHGFTNRQPPGVTTLFGRRTSSGIPHEIDAAGESPFSHAVVLEAKASGGMATKAQVALFHEKTFDFYCSDLAAFAGAKWWRLLISAGPPTRSVRRFCAHLGVVLCDPEFLPLPVLLWIAGRPAADLRLPETILREAIRLMEPLVVSLQDLWAYHATAGEIRHRPRPPSGGDWPEDLLFVQAELSAAVLDLYDRERPTWLPLRMEALRVALGRAMAA